MKLWLVNYKTPAPNIYIFHDNMMVGIEIIWLFFILLFGNFLSVKNIEIVKQSWLEENVQFLEIKYIKIILISRWMNKVLRLKQVLQENTENLNIQKEMNYC